MSNHKYSQTIEIKNPYEYSINIYLEPWGEELELQAGKTFVVSAFAENQGEFEIEDKRDEIFIYAWSGSTVKVFCERIEIGGNRPIVPEVPVGFSTSSFLNLMFGKETN